MAIFSSRTPRDLNHDPKPYYGIVTRLRYADAPAGTDYYLRHEPRPEFDHVQHNEPNMYLVWFRSDVDLNPETPVAYFIHESLDDMDLEDTFEGLEGSQSARDHARKVLSRLARLTE